MKRRVWIVVAPLALVLVIALSAFRHQAVTFGTPLVQDANTLEARSFEVIPASAPGRVFDCVGPQADVAPEPSPNLRWTDPLVRDVIDGVQPLSALPEQAQLELVSAGPWLETTLACGGRTTVAATDGIGPFAEVRHGRRQSMPRMMDFLSTAAPLSLRQLLAQGRVDDARERCLDALVLAIGWLRLEGLEAMLPTLGPLRSTLAVCTAIPLDQSASSARFAQRLASVRALVPSFREVLTIERTQVGLRLFGGWLPPSLDVQLPGPARDFTRLQRETLRDRGVPATLALRAYWKRYDAGMRALDDASQQQAGPTRVAALKAAQLTFEAPFLRRFLAADPVDLRYDAYVTYLDSLDAQLDAFLIGAKAATAAH